MQLEMFINFDGNCREAVEFYAKVFQAEAQMMTCSQVPPEENYPVPEADKDKIMYAGLPIGGMTLMFMDFPTGSPFVMGNNINPSINLDDKGEVERIFHALKEGGEVHMELTKTFYSECYGMVKDKFGVIWHVLYYIPSK